MRWDWQVFCEDTMDRVAVAGCFGKGGDVTYLDWMMSAWGWTISVSLLALALALVLALVLLRRLLWMLGLPVRRSRPHLRRRFA